MAKKNQDYGSDEDVFANFRMFGSLGILVRMSDKLQRLKTFESRKSFAVTEETVEDCLLDLINYAILYKAYLKELEPPEAMAQADGEA